MLRKKRDRLNTDGPRFAAGKGEGAVSAPMKHVVLKLVSLGLVGGQPGLRSTEVGDLKVTDKRRIDSRHADHGHDFGLFFRRLLQIRKRRGNTHDYPLTER